MFIEGGIYYLTSLKKVGFQITLEDIQMSVLL